jgi:hypothetical protein
MMKQSQQLSAIWTNILTSTNAPSSTEKLTSKTEAAPQKKSRSRGIMLTQQGWQKLLQADVIYNSFGDRCSLAELSEKTLLDPGTIRRIMSCKVGVDKRTLHIFFEAFNLLLEQEDYTSSKAL